MAPDIAAVVRCAPRMLATTRTTVLAVVTQKGGVGRTTTAINLGAALAELGHQVLLVDLDPQANSTSGLGLNPDRIRRTIYQLLAGEASVEEAMVETTVPQLTLVPSHIDLAGAEIALASDARAEDSHSAQCPDQRSAQPRQARDPVRPRIPRRRRISRPGKGAVGTMTQSRTRGLGRGLDALIPMSREGEAMVPQMIAVDQIRPSHQQVRSRFDAEPLGELAESIRQHGVLQPLLVRRTADGYELIPGERRWRAARLAGLSAAPAGVRTDAGSHAQPVLRPIRH